MSSALVPVTESPVAVVETSASAIAAREKASIEARFVVALQRPRDMDRVRLKLLEACRRPRFAEAAEYSLPRGGKQIVGPSIRLAEEAMRHYGNLDTRTTVIYDDAEKRILKVVVTDLETSLTHEADVVVSKTTERTSPRKGEEVLGSRTNSTGGTTYTVRSTEDDLQNKQASLISKQLRGLALRVVPSDLIEEAIDVARETLHNADAADPTTKRKRMVDAFAGIGVTTTMLTDYLGRPLDTITTNELRLFAQMFTALKDGEATWADFIEQKGGTVTGTVSDAKGTAGLKEKLAAKKTATPAAEAKPEGYQNDSDLAEG
jgi:hypothetical protein